MSRPLGFLLVRDRPGWTRPTKRATVRWCVR